MRKTKQKHLKKLILNETEPGANGFRAEIADLDPKAY